MKAEGAFRRYRLSALALTMLVGLLCCVLVRGGAAADVRIGLVVPVTGANRLAGQFILRGFELAQDEINAAGGILGHRVQLVAADEVDSLEDSIKATRMLLHEEPLAAVMGSQYAEYVLEVLDAVNAARRPFFASSASEAVCAAESPFIWQLRTPDTVQLRALADFAINRLNVRNPAVLYAAVGPYKAMANRVQAHFVEKGLAFGPVNLYELPANAQHLPAVLARLAAGGHDALFALTGPLIAPRLCREARVAGLDPAKIPSLGTAAYSLGNSLLTVGSGIEGWYAVSEWVTGGLCENGALFDQSYSARFGDRPELPAVVSYRTLYLFKQACELAKSLDPLAVNEALGRIAPGMCTAQRADKADKRVASCVAVVRNARGRLHRVE